LYTYNTDVSVWPTGDDHRAVTALIKYDPPTGTAPTVGITSPSNGSSYDEGVSVSFTGTVTDPVDGDLTSSLSWTSNIDGIIGSGRSFSTTTLSVGTHTINACVSNSVPLQGCDDVIVTINSVSSGPSLDRSSIIRWIQSPIYYQL